ncbi:unnamed protein product [Colias eurytheme]|nr:unnamed protein product [Colias eurytheme]
MIAEKTIEGIMKLQNNAFNKDTTQKTETAKQNNDVNKIRRDSFTLISKEHENNVNSNSLSDLTLQYKKLIGNIKKDPAKLEIWNENETTTETKDNFAYSIAKTEDNLGKDVTAKDDNPEITMNETEEKQNDSDESDSGDVIEDEESHEAKKITEKEILQTDATTPEDIFSSKQKDLHGKKTVREEGDKMFVFQSSSEYEEYHEKVNDVLKSGR